MAVSKGEQLMQAILAALNAGTPLATTFRSRIDAFDRKEFPARVLYAAEETVKAAAAHTRLRMRKVRIEHLQTGDAPADALIDPLLVEVAQLLTADPTFGGKAKGIYEVQTQWEIESSYKDLCVAVTEYELHYTTSEDPSVSGAQ